MENKVTSNGSATVSVGGKEVTLPVLKGSVGPDVIDIRKLYGETEVFTYDPGFTSTASCESQITYIDGDKGVLLYRGYPIEQLAEHSSFLEVCYLLLNGELPTASELEDFTFTITHHTMVHEQFDRFFQGFRRDAYPMAIMVSAVGALSAFYHDSTNVHDPKQQEISAHRMIAKVPTIASRAFKYALGQPFVFPRNDLGYAENFLRMCFSVPAEEFTVNPVLAKAMDRIFILHADHEQNASTSTVRLAGSSGANPFACIAAGVACLWGPSHGGANEEALNMLRSIGTVDKIPEFVQGVKDRKYKLMGFGHRVYKNYDPRATVMQKTAPRGAGRTRKARRPVVEGRLGARADRAQRRILHRAQAIPERGLLFGHHPERDGLSERDVHRAVRPGEDRRLDRPVEGDDRGPFPEDRPSPADLHRQSVARLRPRRPAGLRTSSLSPRGRGS